MDNRPLMPLIRKNIAVFSDPKKPLQAHGRKITLIRKKIVVFSDPKKPLRAHGRKMMLITKKSMFFTNHIF